VIDNWIKFSGLSRPERSVCIQAFFLLPLFALSLRLFGIRRLHALLGSFVPENSPPLQNESRILLFAHSIARMVQVAGNRFPFRVTNCLTQSIAVWWFLSRRGIECDLHIGVRKEADELKAHAWVEFQEHVLNDLFDTCDQFSPFHRAIIQGKVNSV
jgi:hypothetical protein